MISVKSEGNNGRDGKWEALVLLRKRHNQRLLSIDIRCWHRDGLLTPNRSFVWRWTCNDETVGSIQIRTEPGRLIPTYRHRSGGEDWKDKSYPVQLDWTPCHFGGERPCFLCPAMGCGRRVAILYGGNVFACRHCYQLAYPSQREAADVRAARRADRIREKLGWDPDIVNDTSWKPKGMHWRTFERLTVEHDAFIAESLAGIALRLGMSEKSILKWT